MWCVVCDMCSGDVFEAGDDVRLEWTSSLDSSHFDVSLLSDGTQV